MNNASSASGQIDTGKVAGRRALRFETLDEVLTEVDRLVEAERAGQLKHLGNWTLGQAFGHLAGWAEFSYTGAPTRPPWFIKLLLRMRKRSFLYDPMRPGVWIPRVEGGTLATERLPTPEAADRLRRVLTRLKTEQPTAPNVIFGPLTHEEWIALNLRHAELHLSFFIPQ